MKIFKDSLSVVLVGKWNRYILTPEWAAKNVFKCENVEVLFPINRPELPPRYLTEDNIIFSPATHRCQFYAQEPYNDEILKKVCQYTRNLTDILKHTPVTAFGANIAFEEDAENFNLMELFDIHESAQFVEKRLIPTSTEIMRQFPYNDDVLKFKVTYSQDKVTFDFNFHYSVTTTHEINQKTTDQLLIDIKTKSLEILNDIYNLELEEDEE